MTAALAVLAALAPLALAALVAFAGFAGTPVLAAAAALTVLVVALGWGVLLDLPSARGSGIVIAVTGWVAVLVALLIPSQTEPLAALGSLLAFCVLVAFGHELSRRDGRPGLVESVTGTVSGQVIALLAAGWVLMPTTRVGVRGIVVASAGIAVAGLVAAMPLPRRGVVWASLGLSVAGVIAACLFMKPVPLAAAVVVGLGVTVVVVAVERLLSTQSAVRSSAGLLAAAAAPVSAVGTVAYAAARLVGH